MRDMDHEQIKSMVAAYVLGSIPPDEVALVRAHILSCDECMAEADSYGEVAGALALAVDPVDLPEGFADRVLAVARGGTTDETATTSEGSTRGRGWMWPALGAAAALVAVVVFTLAVYTTVRTNAELDRTRQALTALLHGNSGSFTLQGQSGAVARMVPTFEGSYLVAAGLQEAPARHVYQLWLMDDGNPVSAGLFDGSDDVSILETKADLRRFDGAAITIEPQGGSAQPTSDPIMAST